MQNNYMNDQSFIEGLRGTYGWDGHTGLSLVTYLEMMLSPNAWGDEIFMSWLTCGGGGGVELLFSIL